MALAEARALVADLVALPWDDEAVARAALEVTTALLAASPRVAWIGGGTVRPSARTPVRPAGWEGEAGLWWVDAAGLGSEAKLARKLVRLAEDPGFGRARVGVADSAVAAYAATYRRTDAPTHRRTEDGREERGDAGQRPGPCVPSDGRSPPFPRDDAPPMAGEGRCPRDAAPAPVRPSAGTPVRPVIVPPGGDAAFLSPFPLALLEPDEDLADTLQALGLRTVGQLAALEPDEVESRFGAEGLALHRLARGLDARGPSAPRDDTLPLVVCDLGSPVATAEPLLFVLKGALGSLGTALRTRGLAAREIALTLTLDDGSVAEKAVRPARPTSHEGTLFDHCRTAFDDWTLPEPVTALAVRAAVTVAAAGEQGDLLAPRWADPAALEAAFDRIRGSEGADAVATPVERDGHLPRDAGAWNTDERTRGRADTRTGGHAGGRSHGHTDADAAGREERERRPDAGRRASIASRPTGEGRRSRDAAPPRTDATAGGSVRGAPPALTLATPPERPTAAALRLLAAPAAIRVRLGRAGLEALRHGGAWHDVTAWSGPERLVPRWWVRDPAPGLDVTAAPVERGAASGEDAEAMPTAVTAGPRDYYSARTADGALWLLFRSAASRRWFVEGWWD